MKIKEKIKEKIIKIKSENKYFQGFVVMFVVLFFFIPILKILITEFGFGYVGLFFLLLAYFYLLFDKIKHWFIPFSAFASLLLTIYAIQLRDIPFIIVNGIITLILIIKLFKKEII